ncbi:flagellar basal-body rod protein FlgC [Anaerocolumna cellulosilytica]|uniref:Flagellar basal-body rod protein FlgC n=1 Tax=Anaerocolumna cellulosilytica TaxID=433286 RepID=A0A6S6R754_9FIRM|nr:flagellar basal body rod protein FlgC [Anaerocolumna cellulosilytica]MBB5197038.1 flagellar basal-body rod protein FlgC [Anaerocolumna cellulosilytica]BCJ95252.1 flagellar basal-body rod protein FlgC [Anaerocolumna cellulosilytica]
MSAFDAMNVSASGMTAQRLRMDLISQNIANVNTTRDENGEAYRRKILVFEEKGRGSFASILNSKSSTFAGNGVKVTEITEDKETAMNVVYDPSHPDADEDGYVTYPNVNTVTEMTNLIDASRAYEANITAFNATKSMALKGLEVGK